MPESETDAGSVSLETLQRENRELRARVRELNEEARDHRLERNEARNRVKELETQAARGGGNSTKELEDLRKENRQLKHRGVFERVARESGAKPSAKALDALWAAIAYESEGEADPKAIQSKIEAAKADYDFLFTSEGETEGAKPSESKGEKPGDGKPSTPPAKPGPGAAGRPAPAGNPTNKLRIRKSDLQSFDPAVNPMMDPHRAKEIEVAKKEGRIEYVDE